MDEKAWSIVLPVLSSLITSAIIGAVVFFRNRWLDSVRLKIVKHSKNPFNAKSAVIEIRDIQYNPPDLSSVGSVNNKSFKLE